MRWALVLALATGCSKKAAPPPAPAPVMSTAEIQRSKDACSAYVAQVCACADKVPAVKHQCDLARALPDAVGLGLAVAANPESKRMDALEAQASVRKTVKECIEETARLPTLGCP